MTVQILERPTMTPEPGRIMTAAEIEQVTQPLYDRSLLAMKAEWKRRFEQERIQPPKTPK